MNKRLKEIAAEIEKEEGRKVELIQRKIVRRGNTCECAVYLIVVFVFLSSVENNFHFTYIIDSVSESMAN